MARRADGSGAGLRLVQTPESNTFSGEVPQMTATDPVANAAPAVCRRAPEIHARSTLHRVAAAVCVVTVMAATSVPFLSIAQDSACTHRETGDSSATEPRIEPQETGPDPLREQRAAFLRNLGEAGEYSQRQARLESARRLAPFDLDWGLR